MELLPLPLPSFQVLFTILLVLFMTYKTLNKSSKSKMTSKPIPGPRKLPVIGNLHQLVSSPLPHKTMRDLARKHGPLMHLQLGEISTVIVSSPEVAKEVMKTHDINFSYRPALSVVKTTYYDFSNIAFAPYGNYWRHLRKVCATELLNAARVQSFRSIREEEVLNLVKKIKESEGKPVNLGEKVFSMTYGITARAAFGAKCKDQDIYIASITELTKLVSGFSLADLYPSVKLLELFSGMKPKAEKIHKENDMIVENIIKEHRERKASGKGRDGEAEDLVDVLLRLQKEAEFPFEDKHIKAVILDIFGAGSETSSTTVEWALSEMMKNPKVMREAQAEVRRVFREKGNVEESGLHELKYLKAVIKETFRMRPPAPLLLPRESKQACEINGYEVPENTRVLINAWALGRDPDYWKEPDRFYPERFLDGTSSVDYYGTNFEFIPFGAGRRICPGIVFAQPNLELPLAQLLFHFNWKLPNGLKQEDLDMSEDFGMTVKRKNDLVLVPTPYQGSNIVN